MREFFGPGWRMYYCQHENTLIVMLGGGDKSTQAKDIAKAKRVAHSLRK
jgi:putative addiction module killer protein